MILSDFHVHTTFCDGAHTPRQMVEAAIEKGMDAIGFSAHAYTFFDESYCLKKTEISRYCAEISALRAEYKGKIRVSLGIEQDLYSAEPTEGYDYVIGSVHYLYKDGAYFSIDSSPEGFRALGKAYGGDFYALCEDYYRAVASLKSMKNLTFIGHLDLVSKFNETYGFFDETHPRYIAAWQSAIDALLPLGKPFEVNTGAMARGYKTVPYPSLPMLSYIKEKGGRVLLSGDTHRKDALCFAFDTWEPALKDMGLSLITL